MQPLMGNTVAGSIANSRNGMFLKEKTVRCGKSPITKFARDAESNGESSRDGLNEVGQGIC